MCFTSLLYGSDSDNLIYNEQYLLLSGRLPNRIKCYQYLSLKF